MEVGSPLSPLEWSRTSWWLFRNELVSIWQLWMAAEVLFYLCLRRHIRIVQRVEKPAPFPPNRRREIFGQLIKAVAEAHPSGEVSQSLPHFLSGWFHGAPFLKIRRGNVEEFLSKSFWATVPQKLTEFEMAELGEYIDFIERGIGRNFPQGHDEEIKCIAVSMDPVFAHHRPLIFYVVVGMLSLLLKVFLACLGFERRVQGTLQYYYLAKRISKKHDPVQPIVFLHGVGIGLFQYLLFIMRLRLRCSGDLILIEMPWVSTRLFESIPSSEEFSEDVQQILYNHHISKACFMAHSYGSFALGWILNHVPSLVDRAILLDPTAILLCLPDVCANFIYFRSLNDLWFRPLGLNSSMPVALLQDLFRRLNFLLLSLFAREVGIARSLSRHLWWYQSNLFASDLPTNSTIFLCSDDLIVPVDSIYRHIKRYNATNQHRPLNCVWIEGLSHGHFTFHREAQDKILNVISSE